MQNRLFYGDNLDVLRRHIKEETIDLCYIDPPFNSKRNYNQIYNNIGGEDVAQARAFTDTWTWDSLAAEGYREIITGRASSLTTRAVALIKGLRDVLSEGSLLAYLVSMTLRIAEIQRVLKPDGTFYLHCDPTASHYLKLVCDSLFCARGGDFRNEIIWGYESGGRSKKDFGRKHDVLLRYTKSKDWLFNAGDVLLPRSTARHNHMKKGIDPDGRVFYSIKSNKKTYKYYEDEGVIPSDVWTEFSHLQQKDPERMGYPTQKPESLMTRIINASSLKGQTILDAYCGCGTTVVVAQALERKWVGIDITYQSVALVQRRLEQKFGPQIIDQITFNGIPRDLDSARALVAKKDDRLRKEFEKWAVLTYTNNRAIVNDKKGGDRGIDGTAYFKTSSTDTAKIILQVKSGGLHPTQVRDLRGVIEREGAALGRLLVMDEPSAGMIREAKTAGVYQHDLMGRSYDKLEIVTVKEMLEGGKRLDIPMNEEVLKSAEREAQHQQYDLPI